MKCPVCNIEAKIGNVESVVEEGYVLKTLHYVCRNQRCDRYNKEIGKKVIKEVREPQDAEKEN